MTNEEEKFRKIKPGSDDPDTEAREHPDGPSLEEMLNGEEEKSTAGNKLPKKDNIQPGQPNIPVI